MASNLPSFLCHYNSYGWDIVNLLHSSMLPDVRRSALREMVGAYRDTLLETFKTFGHPADIVPTELDIVLEIRRLNFASFLVCCSHLPATLSPPGQGLDMEAIGQDSSTTVFHNAAMYTNEIYDRAIKDDIERFMDEGLF
ncbi:hypothetical protein AAG570_000677 [Ranatra chinensis]|uniref:Uncharacterized protein n=1 Tax=Ranatra chinensis TaxID=642074 RepID=A0ABD0YXT0_9HEMI